MIISTVLEGKKMKTHTKIVGSSRNNEIIYINECMDRMFCKLFKILNTN